MARAFVSGVLTSLTALALTQPARGDVWVFEPSLAFDQRFDDNYYLDTPAEDELGGSGTFSASRLVGELAVGREADTMSVRGLARLDALLTSNDRYDRDLLDSNQLAYVDAARIFARSRVGARLSYTRDTASRDIAADLTDESAVAVDTGGITISQATNQVRRELRFEPSYRYDVSRRLSVDNRLSFTRVDHEPPDPQDAIYAQYLLSLQGNYEGALSYDEVTIEDVGIPFTVTGELADFREIGYTMNLRYELSRRSTLTGLIGYSEYVGRIDPASWVFIDYLDKDQDSGNRDILRNPKRDSLSDTTRVLLGVEHQLTPTVRVDVGVGAYQTNTDDTDTYRDDDVILFEPDQASIDALTSEENGWLANLRGTWDTGRSRYVLRYGTDVKPSSIGTQVETQELTGDVFHTIGPRQRASLRLRLYEPGRVGDEQADRFARRFLSIEPRYTWAVTRDWSVSAAYRYRRQKAMSDPESAESNAILLSIKYVPPSEIRDAQREAGL